MFVDVFVTFGNFGDDEVNVVSLVARKGLEVLGLDEGTIDKYFLKIGLRCSLGVFLMEAFSTAEDGREKLEGFVFFEKLAELVSDRFRGLRYDSLT